MNQQAKRNPYVTAVFLELGVKAKTGMLYLVAEKQKPQIPIYTRRRMTWQLRDFCTGRRMGKMQLYGADSSHTPLKHPDPSSGWVTHTGMLLTPAWPWEKNAEEIQKCWP